MAPRSPQSPTGSHSPARSKTPTSATRPHSRSDKSMVQQRSPLPSRYDRPMSRSRSPEHTPRNGSRGRAQTRSRSRDRSRSRSPSRGDTRAHRERSFSRSLSRDRIQSSKIVVEKLTKNVTEAHLREIFGTYGKIENIDLPLNRQFMTNRGTAYIMYDHPSASESAIAHMHEAQLDGALITVSIVLPRRAFSRSPPPARSERRLGVGGAGRGGPPPRDTAPRGFRYASPPRRGGYGGARRDDHDGPDRPTRRAHSRSASPARRRRRSYSDSRSPSRSPPRRRGPTARSPPRRRQRSPSYSSYSSYSRSGSRPRSHSRSRSPSRTRNRYAGRR